MARGAAGRWMPECNGRNMLWKKLQRRRGNLGAQCNHRVGSTNIGNAEPPGYYQTSPKLANAYSLCSNTPLEKRELRKRHGGVGRSGQEVAWTWICSSTAKSQAPAAKGACQLLKLIIKYQRGYWALYIVRVSWKESCISLLGTTTTLKGFAGAVPALSVHAIGPISTRFPESCDHFQWDPDGWGWGKHPQWVQTDPRAE